MEFFPPKTELVSDVTSGLDILDILTYPDSDPDLTKTNLDFPFSFMLIFKIFIRPEIGFSVSKESSYSMAPVNNEKSYVFIFSQSSLT